MGEGTVIKSTGSWYYVRIKNGEVIPCKIKGKYRTKGIRATNPVAVGDHVLFRASDDETGLITDISERKNYIIRRSSNLSKEYQLIATNVDQALLMISLKSPRTHLMFIDRFLISAEAFRIPVILVFNKTDLYDKEEILEMSALRDIYESAGYRSVSVSLESGENLDSLKHFLKNSVTVVAGNSGVGKSTLLNRLKPGLGIKTKEISSYHKSGQHTTTYAEMFFLEDEIRIIDTPGIKGFGMIDIDKEELFHFFPEIFHASDGCKFHNCLHVNEPGCAVQKAVEEGKISESRYLNYLALLEDMGDKYRK